MTNEERIRQFTTFLDHARVIPAVRTPESVPAALASPSVVVYFLRGTLESIPAMTEVDLSRQASGFCPAGPRRADGICRGGPRYESVVDGRWRQDCLRRATLRSVLNFAVKGEAMNRSAPRLPTLALLLSLAGLIATEIARAETS